MSDPGYEDIKTPVLKFLEEANNEAICIICDTGTFDAAGHCDEFREDLNLDEGEYSTCF